MTRLVCSYRGATRIGGATSLCVHEWGGDGAGASPPLVLLHGFTGCGLAWSQAAAVLSAPARILAPDLPGHGESAPCGDGSEGRRDRGDARVAERCTFDAAASALEAALDAAGASPPLVLLHGFTGCGLGWSQAAGVLSAPARILAPDLPGHGESAPRGGESAGTRDRVDAADAERCTFDAAASALEAALDAAGVTSCDLHGYSMGGRLALYFALTRPARVRRLSLESASAGLASASEREARMRSDAQLAQLALEDGIESFVDRWERTPVLAAQLRLPAEERARVRGLRLRNSVEGLAASLRGMGTGAQPYLGERLAELSMPVLVMAGVEDAKFSSVARDLTRGIPDSRLALIADAGHTPHLEQPQRWATALDSFIAETERGESCRSSGRP